MRVYLPLAIAIVAGLVVLVDFFVAPGAPIGFALVDTVTIVVAFGLVLGLINLALTHAQRIRQGGVKALNSGVLLVSMTAVVVAGVLPGSAGPNDLTVRWLFNYVYTPVSAALFALLAFYVVSAAFRTLRVRGIESGLLTAGALLVLVASAPVTLPGLSEIAGIQQWFMEYPVVAGMRGVALGIAIGTVGTSFRVLTGLDRHYLEQ